MPSGLVMVAYVGAIILFSLALDGLSSPETARRGILYGMTGMAIALLASILGAVTTGYGILIGGFVIGGAIGLTLANRIQMTQMPELVAILHSLVGIAAVFVGFASFSDPDSSLHFTGVEKTIHDIEIYIGILIGAVTFSGSVIAFGKLSGKISGNPLLLPARHWFNLGLLLITIWVGVQFVDQSATGGGMMPLLIMTAVALLFGIHMVMAIGGADMPVVISMLNSYSGWAAAGIGFTLENELLIITGALVGSSGAILSYIMCKAMNRSFLSVILGGFGGETAGPAADVEERPVKRGAAADAAFLMQNAAKVIIVPGYGMAVAQAQHALREMADQLKARGVEVKYAIHPVAGRMPGHMNVLLAEADVDYDKLREMDEINLELDQVDVAIVLGANDVVNPVARTDPNSPIAGMPIIDVDKARTVIVIKRSLSPGFAGIANPLFAADNALMLFADAREAIQDVTAALKEAVAA